MAKALEGERAEPSRKPVVWLHGEVKTSPFTPEGRQEAGMLLRLLQEGERLGMPQAARRWAPMWSVAGSRRRAQLANHVPHRLRRGSCRGGVPEEDSQDTRRSHRAVQETTQAIRRGH